MAPPLALGDEARASYKTRNRRPVRRAEPTGDSQLRHRLLGRSATAGDQRRTLLSFEEGLVVAEHCLKHLDVVLRLRMRNRQKQPQAAGRIGPLGCDSPPGAEKAEGRRWTDRATAGGWFSGSEGDQARELRSPLCACVGHQLRCF